LPICAITSLRRRSPFPMMICPYSTAFQVDQWIQPLALEKSITNSDDNITYSLADALNNDKKIILVGNSGSGKTLALKIVTSELNQSSKLRCCWIPLKNYSRNLGHTIKENLSWRNVQDDQVVPILEQQNITLLFDGLNEVTIKDQEECIKEIQTLLDTYQGHVCVSYPISDVAYFGLEYPTYKVLPLQKQEIEKTTKAFFSAKGTPKKSEWFLQTIRGWDSTRQQDFDKLANLPINLQFMLELAQDSNFSYNSLGDLYGQVIQKRLERTRLHSQQNQVHVDLKTDCLMGLAYQAIIKDQQLQMQKEFVRSTLVEVTKLTKVDVDLALKEIIRAGLLLEVNDFLVEWPHSSFRDYLAGRQLFNLVEADIAFEEFPLEKPSGFAAAAHATRLLTTQSRNLAKRPTILLSVLRRYPSLEMIKAIADEYHTALEYYTSTSQDLKCDADTFVNIRWGERFLEAFQLVKEVASKNNLPGVDEIPSPHGLKVYFGPESDFCLITFSGENGIQLDKLETFNDQISHRVRRKKPKLGFCLYAPFLLLLDPEIIAYFEVGLWLRTMAKDAEDYLRNWHSGLAIYISPRSEWLSWNPDQELPEPNIEILADAEETMKALYRAYGSEKVKHITRFTDVIIHSKKDFLSWQEIYMPITFQIDSTKSKATQEILSNRLSQIMVQTLPDHRISLWLFVPFIPSSKKLDRGINTFIPFPVPLLNRYYFMYGDQMMFMGNKFEFFVHLRG
jgi:hypothetical protein